MKAVLQFRGSYKEENGVAMVEFALILPLMLLLIISTFDLGNAINQYMALSRIAYEGTRYAATIPGLEQTTAGAGGSSVNHDKVKVRVQALLASGGFVEGSPTVLTENDNNQWVRVTIRKSYSSIFGLYDNLPIVVSATGPFLSSPPTVE